MSRIGRMPVAIPAGVTVDDRRTIIVTVKGPKGTLERQLPVEMEIKQEDGQCDRNKTERFKENEIFTRSDKNPDHTT